MSDLKNAVKTFIEDYDTDSNFVPRLVEIIDHVSRKAYVYGESDIDDLSDFYKNIFQELLEDFNVEESEDE